MAPKTPLPPHAFFTTLLHLVNLEQASEVQETSLLLSSTPPTILSRAGLALVSLTIASLKTGMGGRTVMELSLDPAVIPKGSKGELPEHGIRPGDIVRVGEMPKATAKKKETADLKAQGVEGVVTRVGERAVWVALGKDGGSADGDLERVPDGRLWIVKLANDVTYKRMNQTLTRLLKTPETSYTTLQNVLLGLSSPGTPDLESFKNIEFLDPTLNDSQRDAIRFALASPEVALIHGPPGTGKTYTLIELILQLLRQNLRVLVCGPSNISVDNIVERLALTSPSTPIVRLGHPARLLPSVLNHSLEVMSRTSDAAGIVNDVRKELDQKQASIRKTRNARERRAIYADLKELRKEYREREGKCVDDLVTGSKVVLSTLHGAGGYQVRAQEFDVVVIDEASQALEPQCWIPLVFGGTNVRKLVLAGDHLQLPPTIKTGNYKANKDEKKVWNTLEKDLEKLSLKGEDVKKAISWSLETTMFDRLLEMHGPGIKRLLNVQYRMHERIMRFPSDELYESKLIAAESVKARLLTDLPYEVQSTEDTMEPLIYYDTQGGDFYERTEDEVNGPVKKSSLLGDSKSNEMEAALAALHVSKLVDAGVKDEDIAVVTPYNGQLSILSTLLREKYPGIELGSVDGFQGREKEAVVVSLVRSNAERDVGFLGEKRRLNVAMTRPKRHLCIVGDSETVSGGSSFLKHWVKYLEEKADLRYPNLAELEQG